MKLGEWLSSKKFKTAVVAAIVPFVCHYLDLPMEVAQTAVAGLVTAILGFAHQDYGKARDALSNSQLDVMGSAVLKKVAEALDGKVDHKVVAAINGAVEGLKD